MLSKFNAGNPVHLDVRLKQKGEGLSSNACIVSTWTCSYASYSFEYIALHEKMDLLIFANEQICIKYDIY